jgi:hypothetical protein
MNAMTWYDHRTESIWSQPWGRAIEGRYRGVELFPLPFQLTSWRAWRTEHPDTLVMTNELAFAGRGERFSEDFVIGLLLAGESTAYYYRDVVEQGVVNDTLGTTPVFIWAADENFHAYIRQVNGQTLTFYLEDSTLRDRQTGSTWNVTRGLATAGPLQGEGLQPVPAVSAFDWAWQDFYPQSELYVP